MLATRCRPGANALGFNFIKQSPRFVTVAAAQTIAAGLPDTILRVGVFVNETAETITKIASLIPLDVVQLHGRLPDPLPGLRIWRAISVDENFTPDRLSGIEADAFLLDAPPAASEVPAGASIGAAPPVYSGEFCWPADWTAQCGARHRGGESVGGGRLFPDRIITGEKGRSEGACIRGGGAEGVRSARSSERLPGQTGNFVMTTTSLPDSLGHFGPYGGRYVPEVLMSPLENWSRPIGGARRSGISGRTERSAARTTPAVRRRFTIAKRLSENLGGAQI